MFATAVVITYLVAFLLNKDKAQFDPSNSIRMQERREYMQMMEQRVEQYFQHIENARQGIWKYNTPVMWYNMTFLIIYILLMTSLRRHDLATLVNQYQNTLWLMDIFYYVLDKYLSSEVLNVRDMKDMRDVEDMEDVEGAGLQRWGLIGLQSVYTQWLCRILLLLFFYYYNPFRVYFQPCRAQFTQLVQSLNQADWGRTEEEADLPESIDEAPQDRSQDYLHVLRFMTKIGASMPHRQGVKKGRHSSWSLYIKDNNS